jgi:hypothetical protein
LFLSCVFDAFRIKNKEKKPTGEFLTVFCNGLLFLGEAGKQKGFLKRLYSLLAFVGKSRKGHQESPKPAYGNKCPILVIFVALKQENK